MQDPAKIKQLQDARVRLFSLLEVQARLMLEESRTKDDTDGPWTTRQMVRSVFSAMYANSLSMVQITEIGRVLTGHICTPALMQRVLTAFVTDGLLRSRMSEGTRLYELNFPD
jgi:predicted ATPase